MAPDATNPARGEAPGLGKLSLPGRIDNRDNSPPSLVAQIKIAPLQQDFAAGLSRATATSCILGVDPGTSGAIAFYFPAAPNRVAAEDMPIVASEVDCATLAARIRQMAQDLAIVECVASMPAQGVSSTFKFGGAYGAVLGVLAALQIPTHLVSPTIWKRHFRLDLHKEKSRALALRVFAKSPEHFARKRDHGRAEAALLALYGFQQLNAVTPLTTARPGFPRAGNLEHCEV